MKTASTNVGSSWRDSGAFRHIWRIVPAVILVTALFAWWAAAPQPGRAAQTIPYKMNFQGRLTNNAGNIMPDGLYNAQFRIYDASTAGTQLWTETRETTNRVQVTNGVFSVQLGDVTSLPPSIFNSASPRFFEITLADPATATCSTAACAVWESPMTPRQPLASAGYAFNADMIDGIDGENIAQLNQNNVFVGTNIFRPSTDSTTAFQVQNALGNNALVVDTLNRRLGVGVATATAALHVQNVSGTNVAALINQQGTGEILNLQANGTNVVTVGAAGSALFKNTTNSVTALQVQDAASAAVLTVDTTNRRLVVGSNTLNASAQIFVAGMTPTVVSQVTTSGPIQGMDRQGNYVYTISNNATNTLQIYDLTNISAPSLVGQLSVASNVSEIEVHGKYAYLGLNTATDSIRVIDISNPKAPVQVGQASISAITSIRRNMVYHEGYLYVGTNEGLQQMDVRNPAAPTRSRQISFSSNGNNQYWITIRGDYLYFAANFADTPMGGYNIKNPTSPVFLNYITVPSSPLQIGMSLALSDRYAYVGTDIGSDSDGGMNVVDLSNPASLALVTNASNSRVSGANPNIMTVRGNYVFIGTSAAATGLRIYDITNPTSNFNATKLTGQAATTAAVTGLDIYGNSAVVTTTATAGTNALQIFSLGGAFIETLESGAIRADQLDARNGTVSQDLQVGTNLFVGNNSLLAGKVSIGSSLSVGTTATVQGSLSSASLTTGAISAQTLSLMPVSDGAGVVNIQAATSNDLLLLNSSAATLTVGAANNSDRLVRLATPAATPPSQPWEIEWTSDGIYGAVVHSTAPYITIYKRSGDTFTKLADPATLPPAAAGSLGWSGDGQYLTVTHNTAPFITIYKRSGDTFTKLADPATLPLTGAYEVDWSADSTYMSVAVDGAPYIYTYKRSGDTFTKLADPADLPTDYVWGLAWSPDSTYLALNYEDTPWTMVYKRSGDTFTKIVDADLVAWRSYWPPSWSPDGGYLVVPGDSGTGNSFTWFKRTGDDFALLADPIELPSYPSHASWSPDGTYLTVSNYNAEYIYTYKRTGDTLTKLQGPSLLTSSATSYAGTWLPTGQHIAVGLNVAPYIAFYKTSGLGIASQFYGNLNVAGINGTNLFQADSTAGTLTFSGNVTVASDKSVAIGTTSTLKNANSGDQFEIGNYKTGGALVLQGDVLQVQDTTGYNNNLVIDSTGRATFKNRVDSTTAFSVQNAAAGSIFNVDTTNGRVGIGAAALAAKLEVYAPDQSGEVFLVKDDTGSLMNVASSFGPSRSVNIFVETRFGGSIRDLATVGNRTNFDVASGTLTLKNVADNASALSVQNAAGTPLLTADTASMTVTVARLVSTGNIDIGSGSDLFFAGSGNTRNAITKSFTCTSTEAIGNPVVITGTATVGQSGGGVTNNPGVVGVVVSKPTATSCVVAFSGVVQVLWNSSTPTVGDIAVTSGTAGAAMSSTTPATGAIIGKVLSGKDGSSMVWIILE